MEFAVFLGDRLLGRGDLPTVAQMAHENAAADPLVIGMATGRVIDLDLRGSRREVLERLRSAAPLKASRGRPKLGVVAREVTLLPRHWDWLASQPGGASAALRRLVDEARRESASDDAKRQLQEAAYRAATTLAGDRPGYEDAIRALFAGDFDGFRQRIAAWPPDIAAYLGDLIGPS